MRSNKCVQSSELKLARLLEWWQGSAEWDASIPLTSGQLGAVPYLLRYCCRCFVESWVAARGDRAFQWSRWASAHRRAHYGHTSWVTETVGAVGGERKRSAELGDSLWRNSINASHPNHSCIDPSNTIKFLIVLSLSLSLWWHINKRSIDLRSIKCEWQGRLMPLKA